MLAIEKQTLKARLARHTRNLALLSEQKAKYGLDVPLRLIHQIDDEQKQIAEVEARLSGALDQPSLAAQYFSQGTQALISGDLWEARRFYKMTLAEDSFYPRAEELLALVERLATDSKPGIRWTQRLSRNKQYRRYHFILILMTLITALLIGALNGLAAALAVALLSAVALYLWLLIRPPNGPDLTRQS